MVLKMFAQSSVMSMIAKYLILFCIALALPPYHSFALKYKLNEQSRHLVEHGEPEVAHNVTRPIWKILDFDAMKSFFDSSEMLQMYHIGAIDTLYEQGGLNHALSFRLTALAFQSLERPSVQAVVCYQPSNMTVSLIPIISDDGLNVSWSHLGGSVVYTKNIDSDYWTSASYLASTTGSMFTTSLQLAGLYQLNNPHYQPFSVYQKDPRESLVAASSCDEFVWVLVEAANSRGVTMTPVILPKKIKIILYSDTDPVVVDINEHGGESTSPRLDIVSYYRSLAICLQTRKYSFITSLSDFAKYFDCLSDVAYIGLDQSKFLRVNLTSSVMEHVVAPAVLPDLKQQVQPLTWFDIFLLLAIFSGLAIGCQKGLWRAGIPQHMQEKRRKKIVMAELLAYNPQQS